MTRAMPIGLLAVAAVSFAAAARADGVFRESGWVPMPLSGSASALAVADFDGDGRSDFAALVTWPRPAAVEVVFNDFRPGFDAPAELVRARVEVGLRPIAAVAADFDGDGAPDLVVVDAADEPGPSLRVLRNAGDGQLFPSGEVRLDSVPCSLEPGDFDGDGLDDLVLSASGAREVVVLRRFDGERFLAAERAAVPAGPTALSVDDFDADGALDIAAAHSLEGVCLFAGRGNGGLELAGEVPLGAPGGPDAVVLESADIDADGLPDLVARIAGGELFLLRNLGAFELVAEPIAGGGGAREVGIGWFDRGLEIADLDADGDLDIAAAGAHSGANAVRVFSQGPGGEFRWTSEHFAGPGAELGLAVEDFDADGWLDLATSASGLREISVSRGLSRGGFSAPQWVSLQVRPVAVTGPERRTDGTTAVAILGWDSFQVLVVPPGGPLVTEEQVLPFGARRHQFTDIASGDVDGDGGHEVLLSETTEDRIVIAARELPSPRWRFSLHEAADEPQKLAIGDFDGDRRLDAVATTSSWTYAQLLLAVGAEDPPDPIPIVAGLGQTAVDVADADGDGDLDLAISNRTGVGVYLGDGRGGFELLRHVRTPALVDDLVFGPVDGDAQCDLAVATRTRLVVVYDAAGPEEPRSVSVPLETLHGVAARAAAAADIDGDGAAEVVTTVDDRASEVLVFRGDPRERLGEPERYRIGMTIGSLVLGELDGDGVTDCLAVDVGTAGAFLLSGRGGATGDARAQFLRGDADGDGAVRLTDPVFVLERLFRGGAPLRCEDAGDADDDGRVSITDAVYLLGYLFLAGPPPPPPFPEAGADPTPDGLAPCSAR